MPLVKDLALRRSSHSMIWIPKLKKKMGMTIPEIFENYGEAYFREIETEFLRSFRDEYCIIATGGGVPMRRENRELMRNTGLVFYLNAPFRDIWRRISTDRNRPIVQRSTRNELEIIYTGRLPQYLRVQLILKSRRKIGRFAKLQNTLYSKLVGLREGLIKNGNSL